MKEDIHFIRPIKIGGKIQKEKYDIEDELRIGSSNSCNIIISGLAPEHITVSSALEENIHIISKVLDTTFYNGKKLTIGKCTIPLKHQDCIVFKKRFSGETLIYKNEYLNQMEKDSQKISNVIDANQHFGFVIPKKIAKLNEALFLNCPTSKHEFGKYLINFLFEHFPIERATLFEVTENEFRWNGIHARASERFMKVSRTLIRLVKEKRTPILFSSKEDENKSLSIVQQKVSQAFIFPIFTNKIITSALYLDTKQDGNTLASDDFMIISSFIPGISACLKSIQNTEKEYNKNILIAEELVRGMIPRNSIHSGINNFIFYGKKEGESHFYIICDIEALPITKLTIALYIKNSVNYDINNIRNAYDQILNYIEKLPSKMKANKFLFTFITIKQNKKVHIYKNNKLNTIFRLPICGKKQLLGKQQEEANINKNDRIVFLPYGEIKQIDDLNKDMENFSDNEILNIFKKNFSKFIFITI